LHSASSRPLWLLLSVAVAFGVLAWSAQREPSPPGRIVVRVVVLPQPGSSTLTDTYVSSPAGSGFFRLSRPVTMISGLDTITGRVQFRKLP
jgi:hypothetical protein